MPIRLAQMGPNADSKEMAVPMINTIVAGRRSEDLAARRLGNEAAESGGITSSQYSRRSAVPGISNAKSPVSFSRVSRQLFLGATGLVFLVRPRHAAGPFEQQASDGKSNPGDDGDR